MFSTADEARLGYTHDEATQRFKLPTDRNLYVTKSIVLSHGDTTQRIEEMRQYFHKTFEVYEKVFECINCDEGYTIQPVHKLRHPLIFYLGHTATFYMNKLVVAGLTTRINHKFEDMFAVGVDEMSWDDLNDAHYNWPKVHEVWAYRRKVRDHIDELLRTQRYKLTLPLTILNSTDNEDNAFYWTLNMGMEHERIHLETASIHVRELPLRLVRAPLSVPGFWAPCTETNGQPPRNELVPFPGGVAKMGRAFNHPLYGWDCDYSADGTSIQVAPFKASRYLVSNAEFFEFVKDGGYRTQDYWDDEGWRWVSWKKPAHPWFWVADGDGGYRLRVQVAEIPLPWDWPCEVNNLEAKAFCNWKGRKLGKSLRLLTEAEWTLLHDAYVPEDLHEWKVASGNVNLEQFRSSCPVNKFKQGELFDITGNVWQHCETPTYPFPGFRVHPFYDDFSVPTFDGRHASMKGGAWISTGNEATRDARFAFRRHFFQSIGIRYVEGEDVNEAKYLRNALGLDPEVDAAADYAYGKHFDAIPTQQRDQLADFPHRLAQLSLQTFNKFKGTNVKSGRTMDLFCGAGRVTFELAPFFSEAIGVNSSARHLQPAFSLRERGQAQYSVVNEFGRREARTVYAKDFPWGCDREKAFFYQSDPSNLHPHLDKFDLVVVWNVLERTYKPQAVPAHVVERVNKGGIIVFASSFAWDPKYANESAWFQPSTESNGPVKTAADFIRATLRGIAEEVDTQRELLAFAPHSTRHGDTQVVTVLSFRKL
jgi:5-histidylcysteine sulfoxide synthase/putative 4-mercaptohistidine N1-methyltranferase